MVTSRYTGRSSVLEATNESLIDYCNAYEGRETALFSYELFKAMRMRADRSLLATGEYIVAVGQIGFRASHTKHVTDVL
jgi:hypothetical protein